MFLKWKERVRYEMGVIQQDLGDIIWIMWLIKFIEHLDKKAQKLHTFQSLGFLFSVF